MHKNAYRPVIEIMRGSTIESIHYGAVAVVDMQGHLLASYGDPNIATFMRSAAKPFQALPFIEAEGHQYYHLTSKEIALICSSHSGTDEHVQVVKSIQKKVGGSEGDLKCGTHPPYHQPTAEAMLLRGEQPTANRHNCSGKHTGMLAYARLKEWSLQDYLEPGHGVQKAIRHAFAEMCELPIEKVHVGIDGCSAPNFAVPLINAALAWARLADPSQLTQQRAQACRVITSAMTTHPEMIGGPGRFDTALMHSARGQIIAKAGAEGYQGIGLIPGALGADSPALGIALKISDGDGLGRARPAVVLEVLRQLGALDSTQLAALSTFGPRKGIKNWRNFVVGELRPVFNLDRTE